jgi:hypothetical protein
MGGALASFSVFAFTTREFDASKESILMDTGV